MDKEVKALGISSVMQKLLYRWIETKKNLSYFKDEEMELRLKICKMYFKRKTGQFTVKDSNKVLDVIAKSNTRIKIDKKLLNYSKLTQKEKDCLTINYEVKRSALKELPVDSVLFDCLTEVEAAPELKVNTK